MIKSKVEMDFFDDNIQETKYSQFNLDIIEINLKEETHKVSLHKSDVIRLTKRLGLAVFEKKHEL